MGWITVLQKGNVPPGYVLVDMYSKCRSLDATRRVFDKFPIRDVVTRTTMIGSPYRSPYTLHQEQGLVILPVYSVTFLCLNAGSKRMLEECLTGCRRRMWVTWNAEHDMPSMTLVKKPLFFTRLSNKKASFWWMCLFPSVALHILQRARLLGRLCKPQLSSDLDLSLRPFSLGAIMCASCHHSRAEAGAVKRGSAQLQESEGRSLMC